MKKILLLVVLAVIGVVSWYVWETRKRPKDEIPKTAPLAVSRYGENFNRSVNVVLGHYYALSESLVKWDSAAVRAHASELRTSLATLDFTDLKKDTAIYETATSYTGTLDNDLHTILNQQDLVERRRAFHSLSQNFYDLLRTIRYDDAKIYLQECPMAFNDTENGIWLSNTSAIRNPYLGLHHPKYKSSMLRCGETKDSLSFSTAAQTAE